MVLEMTEVFFNIGTTLLTILAMLLAFEMFFCTLRFSMDWSDKTLNLFKIMIPMIFTVILICGITCIYCFQNPILRDFSNLFYILNFIIIFMVIAALIVTVFTVSKR